MKTMPPFPQGEPAFVKQLKKHEVFFPNWDTSCGCEKNELDTTRGIKLESEFPDPEHLLETAFFDFRRFVVESGIAGDSIPRWPCGSHPV